MEMACSDGNLLATEYHRLDSVLVLIEGVPANVIVTLISEYEKGFLRKVCHLCLVQKGSS